MFEVIVFTASNKAYADLVLNYLDPHNQYIAYRLYREHCALVEGVYMKDLRILSGRDLSEIVIVDNAAYSFAYQLDNGVPIISWTDDEDDEELLNLVEYLRVLAIAADLREINRHTFRLHCFHEEYLAGMAEDAQSGGIRSN